MESKRRTQADRTAATRGALIAAARGLFAQRGYADVGTPEIAATAGVTRGAMYHHFAGKEDVFRAVAVAVEIDVTERLTATVGGAGHTDPLAALHHAARAWLDLCAEPEVRQVLLVDGPTVLGWAAFRDLAMDYGLGLTEALLAACIEAGRLPALPPRALAHVVLGALQEAALMVAADADARADADAVVAALIDGLAADG